MRILLDTHAFLWALAAPGRLGSDRIERLENPDNRVFVSSITIAELMIKRSIGKLKVEFDPVEAARLSGFEMIDFTGRDALQLGRLPLHHKDPFDRMLISQAIAGDISLMTDDAAFHAYDCRVI
ncbi:MAG: type II toxin-antitoxin system VapC family toxin [Polyangia bacterium]